MHELELAVLEVFRGAPTQEISTSLLVQRVFDTETAFASGDRHNPQDAKLAKTQKAKLHRKLLYHVNKLVDDNLLRVVDIRGKGEKCFGLTIEGGNVEIKSGRKKIRIYKPTQISTPIDAAQGVFALAPERWTTQVNALFLEGERFEDLQQLIERISELTDLVNDCVGVLRFDTLIYDVQSYELFTRKAAQLSMKIILVISYKYVADHSALLKFCSFMTKHKPDNVEILFNITPKLLQTNQKKFAHIVQAFIEHKKKVHIKNSTLHAPPIISGEHGTYSLSKKDWDAYNSLDRKKCTGLVVGAASVIIDKQAVHVLHKEITKAIRSLFLVGRARRTQPTQFDTLVDRGITFAYVQDHVRVWNYSFDDFAELATAQEIIAQFCLQQHRVYRACGMPIRVHINLGSTFGKIPELSGRAYTKTTIKNMHSLQEEKMQLELVVREKALHYFLSDRVRFFRGGSAEPDDVLKELCFLVNSYNIPFITYDFTALASDVKLTDFFGGPHD